MKKFATAAAAFTISQSLSPVEARNCFSCCTSSDACCASDKKSTDNSIENVVDGDAKIAQVEKQKRVLNDMAQARKFDQMDAKAKADLEEKQPLRFARLQQQSVLFKNIASAQEQKITKDELEKQGKKIPSEEIAALGEDAVARQAKRTELQTINDELASLHEALENMAGGINTAKVEELIAQKEQERDAIQAQLNEVEKEGDNRVRAFVKRWGKPAMVTVGATYIAFAGAAYMRPEKFAEALKKAGFQPEKSQSITKVFQFAPQKASEVIYAIPTIPAKAQAAWANAPNRQKVGKHVQDAFSTAMSYLNVFEHKFEGTRTFVHSAAQRFRDGKNQKQITADGSYPLDTRSNVPANHNPNVSVEDPPLAAEIAANVKQNLDGLGDELEKFYAEE